MIHERTRKTEAGVLDLKEKQKNKDRDEAQDASDPGSVEAQDASEVDEPPEAKKQAFMKQIHGGFALNSPALDMSRSAGGSIPGGPGYCRIFFFNALSQMPSRPLLLWFLSRQ